MGLIKGIIGFEIAVDDLQGKKKLSQNRSPIEKENIIAELSKSSHSTENDVAAYMAGLK